jgi:glycosyltransferase involved in cell wall biosynthesis
MKLSIITINRNNAPGLRKTIESVVSQSFKNFEYIVIDGASTDESVDIIKSYSDKISYWVSEPDTGIYNAMNKGIKLAKGEYTLMLNSGDYLVNDKVIQNIIPFLDDIDIVQGNTVIICSGKDKILKGYGKSDISFCEVYKGNFLHQATFAKKELFTKYGYFDENYKIGGDTVFFLKSLGFGNATFKYVNVNIAYFDTQGISANQSEFWNEQRRKEDEMYDQLLSPRLLKLCKEDSHKIETYDTICKNTFTRKLFYLLLNLSKWKINDSE